MRIGARVDQLGVNSKPVADSLDVAFQKMGNSQLLADLTRVSRISAFVKVPGRATDDLEVCDSREVGDYFILDTYCEKCVLLIVAKIVKRQHRDALFRDLCGFVNAVAMTFVAGSLARDTDRAVAKEKQSREANNENCYNRNGQSPAGLAG